MLQALTEDLSADEYMTVRACYALEDLVFQRLASAGATNDGPKTLLGTTDTRDRPNCPNTRSRPPTSLPQGKRRACTADA